MKMLWCWRCRQEMPMLEEHEYAHAFRLYGECFEQIKQCRKTGGVPLTGAIMEDSFHPLRKWYEALTGFARCHHHAIMHHRLSDFGPPCRVCGKPLRSPRAKMCAACGSSVGVPTR